MNITQKVKDEIRGLMDQIRTISSDKKNLERAQYFFR
jgi:hypothetical protein